MKDWILSGEVLVKVGNLQTDECKHCKPSIIFSHMKGSASELNRWLLFDINLQMLVNIAMKLVALAKQIATKH